MYLWLLLAEKKMICLWELPGAKNGHVVLEALGEHLGTGGRCIVYIEWNPMVGHARDMEWGPIVGHALGMEWGAIVGQACDMEWDPTLGQACDMEWDPTLGQACDMEWDPTLGQAFLRSTCAVIFLKLYMTSVN